MQLHNNPHHHGANVPYQSSVSASVAPSSTPSMVALARSPQGPRVLVIEDNQHAHATLFSQCQRMLQPTGYVLEKFTSHQYIIELLQNSLFDLVILALEPTQPTNIQLLETMRLHMIDVPVLVVTTSLPTPTDRTLFRLLSHVIHIGIQGIALFPANATEFEHTISSLLEKHQREVVNQRNMMQQVVQTEKLAIAGRIVASIAHEMNNPLQALHNALQLLGKRSFNGKKRLQYLQMAQEEVGNLITIVRRMIDLYRPSTDAMRPTNLNLLLDHVLQQLDKQLHTNNVRVLRDWSPRLPNVIAIASRMKQVCNDLITNAIQAMPHGGTLTIRTYTTNGAEYQVHAGLEIRPSGAAGHSVKGPAVVIEISDTGIGIANDALTKIFEPFYTTRFHATGLGLAISYSIVEQHHGELSVSSAEGQGTTVRMRLPAIV